MAKTSNAKTCLGYYFLWLFRFIVQALITGLSSIVGFCISLFPYMNSAISSDWGLLFIFTLGVSISIWHRARCLKSYRFISFSFRRWYLELGSKGGVYVTKIEAICPHCNSGMNLRNVGPPKEHREDILICKRNPWQHRISLDATALTDIEE